MRVLDTTKSQTKAGTRLIKRTTLLLTAVAVLAGLVLAVPGSLQRSEPASAAASGPEMRLDIKATTGGFCNGNTCYAAAGSTFTLAIDVVTAPTAGYILFETYINFGTFDPTASEDGAGPNTCSDGVGNGAQDLVDRYDTECVIVDLVYKQDPVQRNEIPWPDRRGGFRQEGGPGLLFHGGITGLTPPLDVSSFEGTVVAIDMTCPATPVQASISLLPYGDPIAHVNGALFAEPDTETPTIPKVNSITVDCMSPQSFPSDTDGDGCPDAKEEGSDPALGGDRDFLNPWDFYDVNDDLLISLFGDILPVIMHQGPAPLPTEDVIYDRGPVPTATPPLNPWDMTEPNGVIDSIDVDGVYAQYGHDCN